MKRSQLIIIGVVLCLLAASSISLAETRSIYIGDIIRLKVENTELTAREIKQKFKEEKFEIVNLMQKTTGYQLAVRNFEPGAKVVELPNKKIKIDIKSTLKEIDREQIYGSQLGIKSASFSVPYHYLLYGLIAVAVGGVAVVVWKFIRQRQKSNLTPYQQFHRQVEAVEVEAENYLADLTLAAKRYLETEFDCRLAGKTAVEVAEEISNLEVLGQYQTELVDWLEQVAIYKYTQQEASAEEKQQLTEELIELVEELESKQEAADNCQI